MFLANVKRRNSLPVYVRYFENEGLIMFENKKFSLHTLVLCLFSFALFFMGSLTFLLNYYSLDRNILKMSYDLIGKMSELTQTKIVSYTQIFDNNISLTKQLINDGLLNPADIEQLEIYLLNVLKNNKEFINVYWADTVGNLYIATTKASGEYVVATILRNDAKPRVIEKLFDSAGKFLSVQENLNLGPDPRIRPWYQQALQAKSITWTDVYTFHAYSSAILPILGMTACTPVYAEDGALRGVFAIDTNLELLARSMYSLNFTKDTKDTMVFLVNRNETLKKLLQPYSEDKQLTFFSHHTEVQINTVNTPWAEKSLEIFKQHGKRFFVYEYAGNKYLAFYKVLNNVLGGTWRLAVTIPLDNVILPFKHKLITLTIIIFFVMAWGCFFVIFFANRAIGTVKNLFAYSEKFEALNFADKPVVVSSIEEVHKLDRIIELEANVLKSFARFVPTSVIKNIVKSGDIPQVGGENRDVTIVFADIIGSTSLAEIMKPNDLMVYLSEYFDAMTKVISSKGGTLDKYIGDEIMCFWGAPFEDKRHALHACQCTMMLFDALREKNKNWKLRGLPQLSIRAAVNTGVAIVGNLGSSDRLSYTVIGDSVNLTSRLEALNKIYGTEILMGEWTYNAVKGQFLHRLVDCVAVRGKQEGVKIYEIIRRESSIIDPDTLDDYNAGFEDAFKFYQVGDWEKALALFEDLGKKYTQDTVAPIYVDRCKTLIKSYNRDEWDGVWKY